ncbi:ABC transporter ATP-binding protein [[Clostridium] symbiosum]|uniref:ABC transporter ATP-binding protein n=1 Tax=Clostridium symbiosum TaxID=1512 RepID=UPI001D06EF4E|nr:ABC transporter ATP-binding protein [[Clostridium] symbiosum]MCB6611130.1 ABC transporter ATP-binding protein/permease [[Clostridium] symbiosum]MCB6929234.1 ABC transporter ATP-binding protein/permease [[Clostridium] symbiosum]
MKSLMRYLKKYRTEAVMAPLFKMLEASFELFVPLVMAKIIDTGIRNADLPYILRMGGVLILLGVIGLACSLTAQYFAAKAAVGFGTALRKELFDHINHFSYTEIDTEGTATLITRMTSDVNQVQSGVNLTLRLFLRSPFIVFGAMIMAFTIDVKSAMIFVVTIPLLSIVVFGIMLITMPLYKKVQKQLDRVLQMTRENLTGVRVVRAFNRQKDETAAYYAESGLLFDFQIFVGKISALLNPITYVIINLAIVILIYVGATQVDAGAIPQGKLVALVNYMSQILVELIKLANLIITMTKAFACAGRINSVFDTKSSITEKENVTSAAAAGRKEAAGGQSGKNPAAVPMVSFDHVSFAYQGAKADSLSDIHFDAMKGETIGIIGGTGSGKSSVVNLIPRFYDATKGTVRVDGLDVKDYGLKELRGRIGVVPQRAVLFRGSIRDNMKWGKADATDEEIMEALDIAQAKDVVESKQGGLDANLLQGGKNLSGGQRQRLTIARALVRKPDILILDDSASALDFATDARLRKAIREKTDGMTVFIVSQRATTVKQADKILVLEEGSVAGIGKHQELFENCPVYREICLSQLSGEEVNQ